ncbi:MULTISPECIES: hypothetical protein [unclassified Sphingobium]|uniref:hypothetical protein n=1 Tax=unclassified Sphingobium TaxID=2611147 RepID=UPI002224D21B|nr:MULTISPECIES: hypothetical protein [unclassified Sphingobium]MCW2410254.1 hypothetical protein [Sphingobium sp. B8D3D]MCW2414054.1 hypothetical protein [Sphingobium sp. B8D3A]
MNEFLPRAGAVTPVTSATERSPLAVPAVSQSRAMHGGAEGETSRAALLRDRERSAAAADYARIHAEIADVLAHIQPSARNSESSVELADRAIVALMPSPVVMLPMPPTDEQMVTFVANVAQAVARQAGLAQAAQASVTSLMVEAASH